MTEAPSRTGRRAAAPATRVLTTGAAVAATVLLVGVMAEPATQAGDVTSAGATSAAVDPTAPVSRLTEVVVVGDAAPTSVPAPVPVPPAPASAAAPAEAAPAPAPARRSVTVDVPPPPAAAAAPVAPAPQPAAPAAPAKAAPAPAPVPVAKSNGSR